MEGKRQRKLRTFARWSQARGKSYIAEQFGKNEYKSYLLIDFAHLQREVRDIFENDLNDFDLFLTNCQYITGRRYISGSR